MYPPVVQSLLPEVTVSKLLVQSQLALFLCV